MAANENVLKEGFLDERTEFFHFWKQRYWVLTDKKLLRAYKTPKDYREKKNPTEVINIGNYVVLKADHLTGKKFTFRLANPQKSKILRTTNDSTRDLWMFAFRQATEGSIVETSSQTKTLELFDPEHKESKSTKDISALLDDWEIVESHEDDSSLRFQTQLLNEQSNKKNKVYQEKLSLLAKIPTNVFSKERLDFLFEAYQDEDEDDQQVIGPTGMEKLCQDLQIDPEDIKILILAYELKAQRMGYFTRDEFSTGMTRFQADTLEKLKKQILTFPQKLNSDSFFFELYKWTFDFAKDDSDKRGIDKVLAAEFLEMFLQVAPKRFPHTKQFLKFLEEKPAEVGVNFDLWKQYFVFNKNEQDISLKNFDLKNSFWPTLIDEYIDWVKNGFKLPSSQNPSLAFLEEEDEEDDEE